MKIRPALANSLLVIASIISFTLLVELGVRAVYYQSRAPFSIGWLHLYNYARNFGDALRGTELNRQAWRASFSERGIPVPKSGPREGYWGARVNPKATDVAYLRTREKTQRIPGLVDVDKAGLQHAGANDGSADIHILILGGSVAYGAYASSIRETYFEKLARVLARKSINAKVTVLATGAWVSYDELTALTSIGIDTDPDLIIFLNGLNDVSLERDRANPQLDVVQGYLRNMAMAKHLATTRGTQIAFAPQPFLALKQHKTPLEEIIMERGGIGMYRADYGRIIKGLRSLVDGRRAFLIDCSNSMGREVHTTFADSWHFSDPGHSILANALAEGVAEIINFKN